MVMVPLDVAMVPPPGTRQATLLVGQDDEEPGAHHDGPKGEHHPEPHAK
jgi:hypothetical protein